MSLTTGIPTNEPVVFSEDLQELEGVEVGVLEDDLAESDDYTAESDDVQQGDTIIYQSIEWPEDLLTVDSFNVGIATVLEALTDDIYGVELVYVDSSVALADLDDLPSYSVVYLLDGVEVVFPLDYADCIVVDNGQLINFGSSYTAGAQISGYSGSYTYLSSEITIPTYHSSTWYQYLQTYGQPYRIVDRYVNTQGTIGSVTRTSVSISWSESDLYKWQGFTFERIALFGIFALVALSFIYRRCK